MGLVNRVVPDGEVEAYCTALAKRIADNAPLTVGSVKTIVGETLKPESERDLQKCAALVKQCFDSRDYVEGRRARSEEHTSELQSLMRISYAVFCLKKKKKQHKQTTDMS